MAIATLMGGTLGSTELAEVKRELGGGSHNTARATYSARQQESG